MTDINELMGSAFVRVKLVALVHFVFTANAMLGMWGHGAYEYYNFLFIIAMFWTMHSKESIEAAQTALLIDLISIFLDIICLIIYFDLMNGWAVAFAIINLVIRPITVILLYREFNSRGGTIQGAPVFPSTQQRSYQDIDRPAQTSAPNAPAGQNTVPSIF